MANDTEQDQIRAITYAANEQVEKAREQFNKAQVAEETQQAEIAKIKMSENFNEYWKAIKRARIENKELGYGERTKDYNQKKYEEELRMLLIQKRISAYENANAINASSNGKN